MRWILVVRYTLRFLCSSGTNSRMRLLLGLAHARQSISLLACVLVAWLHLAFGLSRAATTQVLKVIGILITMAVDFGVLLSRTTHRVPPVPTVRPVSIPFPSTPDDVRTSISRLGVEPDIIRSICCPKCYQNYSLEFLPQTCNFRETPRSHPCGEDLWTTRISRAGPKRVPRRLYNTQSLESWVEHFLSRPGIEDILRQSYEHQSPPDATMNCLWDSPAWRSLGPFTTTPGNLTFSYYIDWFNPLTNKIAGKTVSCGAIMLFCLNLPYELQRLPENIFFAGITPPPKEPTVTTISAVNDPIIDHLERMWPGRKMRTFLNPEGTLIRIAVLPAIGDLLAMRKALGFAGVASHHFCSFCLLRRADIDNLDYQTWPLRIGVHVLSAAESWRQSTTKKNRKEIFAAHGVRWSSLHRLIYRDPVRHTVLGLMHNWIEGILQHHCRFKWGIGIPTAVGKSSSSKDDDPSVSQTPSPHFAPMDIDEDILDDELELLHLDSNQFDDTPSHTKRRHGFPILQTSPVDDYTNELDSGGDSSSDEDYSDISDSDDETSDTACIFDPSAMALIHHCLANSVVPTWIDRPPTNLGDKSHGKLKADNWLVLFSIFLPLILPEIWVANSTRSRSLALLQNFHDLVLCTNIVCSYSVKPENPDIYLRHYIKYRKSSAQLFPNIQSRPNHHYAMHNADQMRFWGPLIMVSEFSYEQQNGFLQKIKTNGHMCTFIYSIYFKISDVVLQGKLTSRCFAKYVGVVGWLHLCMI